MQDKEDITKTIIESIAQKQNINKLAIASLILGISGPFSAGIMWVGTLNNFLTISQSSLWLPFSYGFTSVLGLIFGIKSLKKIEAGEGHLAGNEYAIVGIIASAAWMFIILIGLFLPVIFSINS